KETVRLGNSGESVTAHLASAMALVGLLVWILARSLYPARLNGTGSQRFTLVAALGAGSVFALLLFGSQVTATSQWYVFPDWPLMNGSLFPALTEANSAHVLHRWVAVIVGLIVAAVFVAALRRRPRTRPIIRLAAIAAILFPIQAVIGGLQILTGLSGWTQTLHLATGAVIWALLVALVAVSYLEADIDGLMSRTRRRPRPAHQVDPSRAVVFGLVLGVVAFAVLAFFVNLLAAFLGLLAIAFYVVVYTILLKRSTPQNIVIGGA